MSSSSSSRATPKSEQDGPLLAIGQQCTHPTCHLVDFLPFKCQHCQESFCQDHYKVTGHSCPNYDESKHNRIAPSCMSFHSSESHFYEPIFSGPLCNEPVSFRPGEDPNVRMEDHFAKECSVMTGHKAQKSKPICAQRKCGKVLFAPIRCDVSALSFCSTDQLIVHHIQKCRQDFCPSHRFPADHMCSAPASSTRSAIPVNSRLLALNTKTSASQAASATFDAIKKTMSTNSNVVAPSQPSTSTSTSKSTVPMPNPFSKVDRYVYSLPISLSIHS